MELVQFPNKPDLHGVDGGLLGRCAVRHVLDVMCLDTVELEWSVQRVAMTMSEIIWPSFLVDSGQLVWFRV